MSDEFSIEILSTTQNFGPGKSLIPEAITNRVREKVALPEGAVEKNLISSSIDDFIAGELEEGVLDEESIENKFGKLEISKEIDETALKVVRAAENIGLSISPEQVSGIQDRLQTLLVEWGVDENVRQLLNDVHLEITDDFGSSDADVLTGNAVRVSRAQAMRKAIDYVAVFGDEHSVEQVAATLMLGTFAHELGHRLDNLLGWASNKAEFEWGNQGDFEEDRSERFAEGISMVCMDEEQQTISVNEWALHLGKTQRLWKSVEKAKRQNPDFNVNRVFVNIKDTLDPIKPSHQIVESRQRLYVTHPVENYALPYSRDDLQTIIQPSQVPA